MKKLIVILASLLIVACDESSNTATKEPTTKAAGVQTPAPTNTVFESKFCYIDTPKKGVASAIINVVGWVFDERSGTAPDKVQVQFTTENGQLYKTFDAFRGTKRLDVVKAFNQPGAEMSGFGLSIPANTMAPGIYNVGILQNTATGTTSCHNGNKFEVVDNAAAVQPPVAAVTGTTPPAETKALVEGAAAAVAPSKKTTSTKKKAKPVQDKIIE